MTESDTRKFTITSKMLDAGAATMLQCHAVGGHTARTVCHAVFTAMLTASNVHPGINHKRTRPVGKFTRADFDARGERVAGHTADGTPIKQYLRNFWYIKEK